VQFVSDNTRFVADSFASLVPGLKVLAAEQSRLSAAPTVESAMNIDRAFTNVDLGFLTDEVPTALDESLEGLGRIAQIVLAMKEFSHPGHARSAADLNRAVETTAQVSRSEWKYLATLELDLDPEVGMVGCHEGDIKQVVLNMIVNAAHAIQERQVILGESALGRISISTARLGDEVRMTIADTGIGMQNATSQRIFDPFFTTKGVGKGTGQGLSLAHATVVQKHSGSIGVQSTYGEGTTFTICLPAPRDIPADENFAPHPADEAASV
jgi:two-component system NtrC family sensor kinase